MERDFSSLGNQAFDVLVIGGGATGAAIAWDATLRGLKVAVIDKGDFSGATSAASSKLMHGGLRYLANGEFSPVREGLRERRIWGRIATHLLPPFPFVLPTYAPLMQSKWPAASPFRGEHRHQGGSMDAVCRGTTGTARIQRNTHHGGLSVESSPPRTWGTTPGDGRA